MPYIPHENRVALDTIIDGLVKRARETTGGVMPGHVNYIITRVVLECLNKDSYHSLSNCVGVLRDSADEIQRRLLGPYEDTAIQKNGDMACFDKPYALRDHAILTCVEELAGHGVYTTLTDGLEAAWEERVASGKKSPYERAQERENFVVAEEATLDPELPNPYEISKALLVEYIKKDGRLDSVRVIEDDGTDCPGCGEPGECEGCDPDAWAPTTIDDIVVNCDMPSLETVADQISDALLEKMENRLELLKAEYFRAAKSNSQGDWYDVWGEELEALDLAIIKIHQVRDATDGRR